VKITRRVILHRNGDPIHFDVTVDLEKIAETIGPKAEKNRSHVSKECGGAVTVEHIA
jgi:hypothetical protein